MPGLFNVRAVMAGVVAVASLVATMAAADVYTRADSTSMRVKIERIVAGEAVAPTRPAPVRTTLTQREVNSYLRYDLRSQVPVGIEEPVITIVGDGRLTGEAVVDLDAVSRANPPKGMFDPMRLLTGRLPVRVQGVLVTSRGTGRFSLESATISGLPVPKSVLQSLVSHYSRSTENPRRRRPRRSLRAAGGDPRDPRRARPGDRRAMSRSGAGLSASARHLEGRRRSPRRRPGVGGARDGRRSSGPVSDSLRRPRASASARRAAPRAASRRRWRPS